MPFYIWHPTRGIQEKPENAGIHILDNGAENRAVGSFLFSELLHAQASARPQLDPLPAFL